MAETVGQRAARYAAAKKPNFRAVTDAAAASTGNLNGTMTQQDSTGLNLDAPAAEPLARGGATQDDNGAITMPQTTVTPATASPATPAPTGAAQDQEANQSIDATTARINELMRAVPDVDYEGKYKALLGQAQSQPVPQAPGRAQSFFAALGSPDQAPGLLSQAHAMQQKASDEKLGRIMSLKEAILHGDIQQQIAKGDFKKALAQSGELEKLHAHQERIGRENALDTFQKQQNILQGNRKELETLHAGAAMDRAREMIKGRTDLAKLTHSQQDQYARIMATHATSMMNMMGTSLDDAMAQGRVIADQAFNLGARASGTPGAGAGASAVPTVPLRMSNGKVTRMVSPDKIEQAKGLGYLEVK